MANLAYKTILFFVKQNYKNLFIYYVYSVVCIYACRPEEGTRSHYMVVSHHVVARN